MGGKQKVVMKVPMYDEKGRSRALKTAVRVPGCLSVAIEGADKIVVIGDNMDSVVLTEALRKKLGGADLVTVAPVDDKKEDEKKPADSKKPPELIPPHYYYYYPHPQPLPTDPCIITIHFHSPFRPTLILTLVPSYKWMMFILLSEILVLINGYFFLEFCFHTKATIILVFSLAAVFRAFVLPSND